MPYERISNKFAYSGMDIHHPPDLLPPGRCSLLFNMQPDLVNGALTVRPPIAQLATTVSGLPLHSIIRVNDSVPGAVNAFSRFVGSNVNLYSGSGSTLALLDNGYSGNPLGFVTYRPNMSPETWLYVYDSSKQQRYKTDNSTKQNIGIASPTDEPSAVRIKPLYNTVDNATATWSAGTPVGGAVTGPSTVARVTASTTISKILYDAGSAGMACIAPTNSGSHYQWMTQGSMIILNGTETAVIEQAFAGNATGTTVAAIQYDSGTTGACVIVPTLPLPGLQRNMLLNLNSGTYVRVTSVNAGPDGSYSFRCSTGGTTISASQTIAIPASFRVWTVATFANGDTLTGDSINFTYTPSPSNGAMNCLVSASVTDDLSHAGGSSGRPLQNEDYMHISMAFDAPQFVTEVHVMLDVDSTTNDFAHNYYYYVLRQGDFQQSAAGVTTTLQDQLSAISANLSSQLITDEYIDTSVAQPPYPTAETPAASAPVTEQLNLGALAWLEGMFKLSDLTRVGSDASRTLANVAAVGLMLYTAGGTVNIYFTGWWAGGGYGPDCDFNSYGNQFEPLQWRYRYRNTLTGAHSTVSPETRNGEILRRQGINITATSSADTQVDVVDFERRGGTNPDWHYVGTMPMGMGTTTFLDNVTEGAAKIAEPLEVTCYQPWPVTDVPHAGTATVTGTSVVWATGDKFNVQWLRGTEIIIGGNTYSLYAPPGTNEFLQLAQNVPPPSGTVAFTIPEATIESQPLYGAWLDEANNRVLAVGDALNPGLLYYSNNDNPDGASDAGTIEITTPSEPLLNGFYAEGANYVFSNTSLYRVESTPGAVNPYASYRLSGVEGLAAPWAFDYQRKMLFYWGPDGIYAYQFGATAENITNDPLYPMFPHAGEEGLHGIPGVPISIVGNTIYPPDYTRPSYLRLAFGQNFVYATYPDTNTSFEALVYSLAAKGWRKDEYKPGVTVFVLEKGVPNPILMCGGVDGNLYEVNMSIDTASAVDSIVYTFTVQVNDSAMHTASVTCTIPVICPPCM